MYDYNRKTAASHYTSAEKSLADAHREGGEKALRLLKDWKAGRVDDYEVAYEQEEAQKEIERLSKELKRSAESFRKLQGQAVAVAQPGWGLCYAQGFLQAMETHIDKFR
jgi:hypothetical protein